MALDMAISTAFADKVLDTVRQHGLFCAGDRVVVAVSGGPDSMALLEAMVELRERLEVWLCVAHLNHGLRGWAAEEDAEFVAARAAALGLEAKLGATDVAAERERRGGSVEMAARRARYAFLERVAAEVEAARVALGHTADDQVETVLQRLLRGGELDALCGMPVMRALAADVPRGPSPAPSARELSAAPSSTGSAGEAKKIVSFSRGGGRVMVVRPLLDVSRADMLDYLAARGVGYRVDESNADVSFQRNLVRHRLLPVLEARWGGGLRATLLRLAAQARELMGVVAGQAEGLVEREGGGARLDVEQLARQPRLVRRAAVRRAYELAGGAGELTRRAIDAVEGLLGGGSGREVSLAGGILAQRSYGELRFHKRDGTALPAVRLVLDVPGRVEVPEVGIWVEAEVVRGPPARGAGTAQPGAAVPHAKRKWEEVVDRDRVGERLVVRTRAPGDRFEPLGLGGRKKLKDFLIDERVPREERARLLVVEGRCGIAWVVGLRLDERAKVRAETRRFARLRAGRLEA